MTERANHDIIDLKSSSRCCKYRKAETALIIKKMTDITIRSSADEYMTNIAAVGGQEDGKNTLSSEFFDMVSDMDKKMLEAYERSDLPEQPDVKKINDLLTEIHWRYLKDQ